MLLLSVVFSCQTYFVCLEVLASHSIQVGVISLNNPCLNSFFFVFISVEGLKNYLSVLFNSFASFVSESCSKPVKYKVRSSNKMEGNT